MDCTPRLSWLRGNAEPYLSAPPQDNAPRVYGQLITDPVHKLAISIVICERQRSSRHKDVIDQPNRILKRPLQQFARPDDDMAVHVDVHDESPSPLDQEERRTVGSVFRKRFGVSLDSHPRPAFWADEKSAADQDV